MADVIRAHSSAPPHELVDRVTRHLAQLNATSTYWPGDDEVRSALTTEPAYNRYPRARLRSFLEALENSYRAETAQPQVERAGHPIEHILPQKWRQHWPVDSLEAEIERQAHVHLLGNLTLLMKKLNTGVSNAAPWQKKRKQLQRKNTMNMTGRLIGDTQDRQWDEELIDHRTTELIDVLLNVWPVPKGHEGRVVDPQAKAQDWVEIKHLVDAGLLAVGDTLRAPDGQHARAVAVVTTDRRLDVGGMTFGTPSGAGYQVRNKITNGWYFWSLADGRRLHDLRVEFRSGPKG